MTDKQTRELIGIFKSARALEKKYIEYTSKLEKSKNERNDENIRFIFDDGISRAYTLFEKDIKTSNYLFKNQFELISVLESFLETDLIIKDVHLKYTNNQQVKIKDVLRAARNINTHSKKTDEDNLLILYHFYINKKHFDILEQLIEYIICKRLNELTLDERAAMIALNPENRIWFETEKEKIALLLPILKEKNYLIIANK